MSSDPEHDIDPRDRLIGLVALRTQELPDESPCDVQLALPAQPSAQDVARLHAHLDAHPEAFEAFIERHRTKQSIPLRDLAFEARRKPQTWSWVRSVTPRYAFAAGIALCGMLVASMLFSVDTSRRNDLERTYSAVRSHVAGQVSFAAQTPAAAFGFAPEERSSSDSAQRFAQGWRSARARLVDGASTHDFDRSDPYAMLGEWNMLWTAMSGAAPQVSADTWQDALAHERAFTQWLHSRRDVDNAITTHLARIDASLEALASGEHRVRAAGALGEESKAFAVQFAGDELEDR